MQESDLSQSIGSSMNVGQVGYSQGDLEKAWALYEEMLPTNPNRIQLARTTLPNNPDLPYYLGTMCMRQGSLGEAQKWFEESIRLKPGYVDAYCQLGRVFLLQKKGLDALVALSKAVCFDPAYVQAHELFLSTLHTLGIPERIQFVRKVFSGNFRLLYAFGTICVRQGSLDDARIWFEESVRLKPDYVDAYCQLGRIFLLQKKGPESLVALSKTVRLDPDYALAHELFLSALHTLNMSQRIQLVRQVLPDNSHLPYVLGTICLRQESLDDAQMWFEESIRLKPDYADACCQLGHVFLQQNKLQEAETQLRQAVCLNAACILAHEGLATTFRAQGGMDFFASYYQRLAWYYAKIEPHTKIRLPYHTFFVNRERALSVARRGLVQQGVLEIIGPQLCFYTGSPFSESLPQLIHVPQEQKAAEDFFCFARLAYPEDIDFDPGVEEERVAAERIAVILRNAKNAKTHEICRLAVVCQQTRPEFIPGQPLRVYLPATRFSSLTMAHTVQLARGFRENGCEVLSFSESNKVELFGLNHFLQMQESFNPHIIVDINAVLTSTNKAIFQPNPEVFKIFWFEDIPSDVSPWPWRERDLIYSFDEEVDTVVYQCGAPQVRRQDFCYDDSVYTQPESESDKKRKIVFIGTQYNFVFERNPGCEKIVATLEEIFEAGEELTEATLNRLVDTSTYDRSTILLYLWQAVCRNTSIRWLSELSNEIDVDIYGYNWEKSESVRPFFKGPLVPGPELATVYKGAQYSLLTSSHSLASTRLLEMTACGVIPIAYDCRYRAAKPHWDNNILWYRTKEDLRACLTEKPLASPLQICQGKTYTEAAKRMLADVEFHLSSNHG